MITEYTGADKRLAKALESFGDEVDLIIGIFPGGPWPIRLTVKDLREVSQLVTEMTQGLLLAGDRLGRIGALHALRKHGGICLECAGEWPCATRRILDETQEGIAWSG